MKTVLLSCLALCATAQVATAQVLASDDFSYPDGSLVPNGGWANHSGTPGDLLVSGGQVVIQHGTPSEDANLAFTPVTGMIYYGIDFNVASPGTPITGTDHEYFAHFRTNFDFSGRLDVVAPTGAGDYSVGIASDESTADAVWPTDLTYGVTYRAIVRYDQALNIATLWIDANSEGDASLAGEDRPDPGDTPDSFGLRQSDSDLNETVTVDNLIVGQTFSDVVGVATGPGTAFCFGDGTSTPCPCGNPGAAGEGCANGTGAGAILDGSGSASIGNADLVFNASQLPTNQPGLFFQADNAIGGGVGQTFGDGLRCAGMNVIRLQVVTISASGTASSSIDIGAKGGVGMGQTKRYQYWYRNPGTSPCGADFNLTNGYEITWGM